MPEGTVPPPTSEQTGTPSANPPGRSASRSAHGSPSQILLARLVGAGRRISTAYDRLPIRTRLATASALFTFVILCVFAVIVGSLTVNRIRSAFDSQVEQTAKGLPNQLHVYINRVTGQITKIEPELADLAGEGAVIKIFATGQVIAHTPEHAPHLGPPVQQARTVDDYRVVSHPSAIYFEVNGEPEPIGEIEIQYGQPVGALDATIARVELLLLLGVLGGVALSLLAGISIARRAMRPIAQLTTTAAEIARTRDPSRQIPEPVADDEVAELARTLAGMLHELDSAHAETEGMLARQRQFVADASHELRTPLTSILANLELLADSLTGDQGDAAGSALRSSQRMRRLVADLLLLARSDVGRVVPHEPLDLAQVAVEAAAEMGPMSAKHEIVVRAQPIRVEAARDELHRMVLNLIENALRHTPPGTEIEVLTDTTDDGWARLVVQDDGPGVPESLRSTLFERFVRGAGDRGGSFGLGLAIVRAVAESHGGSVTVQDAHHGASEHRGARFVVLLPGG